MFASCLWTVHACRFQQNVGGRADPPRLASLYLRRRIRSQSAQVVWTKCSDLRHQIRQDHRKFITPFHQMAKAPIGLIIDCYERAGCSSNRFARKTTHVICRDRVKTRYLLRRSGSIWRALESPLDDTWVIVNRQPRRHSQSFTGSFLRSFLQVLQVRAPKSPIMKSGPLLCIQVANAEG